VIAREDTMRTRTLAILCAIGALAPATIAQEAVNTPAATQPGAGRFVTRLQLTYKEFGDDPAGEDRTGSDFMMTAIGVVGFTGSLSLEARTFGDIRNLSSKESDGEDERSTHWGDTTLSLKWRFWQHDIGPVDTIRASLIAGAELPTGTGGMTSGSVDPIVGAVITGIFGRHGFNQAARWKFTTGAFDNPIYAGESLADALYLDTAYLFRLAPAEYAPDTQGSWYAIAELNTVVETNGDYEGLIGPGILYEGKRVAIEALFQFPVFSGLEYRPETEWVATIGIRFLF